MPSRTMAVAVLLLAAVALAAPLQSQQVAPGPQDRVASVDRIFGDFDTTHGPGCAVAVGHRGALAVHRAYGMANLEHHVANVPSTVFENGSVSKQFAAAAVVLLAQQGRLSLDDDVRTYVPELPDYGEPIRIHHLIHHTSGLRDWGAVVGVAGWPRTSRVHTHAHVIDVISRQRHLNFTPGSRYSYSNSGYNLLAVIVDRVSGESFASFSERHIFEPLGMTRTQWRDDFNRIVEGRAVGYAVTSQGEISQRMPFENVHGNGGLLTTVEDLVRWTEALHADRVAASGFREMMVAEGRLTDGRSVNYASGLAVSSFGGTREISHGGSTAGYRASLRHFPEEGLTVAVLCNRTDANAGGRAQQVIDLFLPERAEQEAAHRQVARAQVPRAALAGITGLYRDVDTEEPLRLVERDGQLRIESGAELVPLSATLFQVGGGDDRISVGSAGPEGRPAVLRRARDGRGGADTTTYERVAEASPSAAELGDYEGAYTSDEAEVTYTAVVDDGRLTLRRRPDVTLDLRPEHGDVFTAPNGWLVRFRRDESGRVNSFSLRLGRVYDLRFERVGPVARGN